MRSFFQRESAQRESEPTPQRSSSSAPARPAPAAPKAKQSSGRETTRIARGSKVVGEISGSAELVIDGRVEGEIELDNRVVVGDAGQVDGKIVGAAVEVAGKVVGNVRGRDRVQVMESGTLEGDVTSPRVVIAEGAFFKGKVEMTSTENKKPARKSPAGAPKPKSKPARSTGAAPTRNRPSKAAS